MLCTFVIERGASWRQLILLQEPCTAFRIRTLSHKVAHIYKSSMYVVSSSRRCVIIAVSYVKIRPKICVRMCSFNNTNKNVHRTLVSSNDRQRKYKIHTQKEKNLQTPRTSQRGVRQSVGTRSHQFSRTSRTATNTGGPEILATRTQEQMDYRSIMLLSSMLLVSCEIRSQIVGSCSYHVRAKINNFTLLIKDTAPRHRGRSADRQLPESDE